MDTVDLGTRPIYGALGEGRKLRAELSLRLSPRVSIQLGTGLMSQITRLRYASEDLDGMSTDSSGYASFAIRATTKQRSLQVSLVPVTIGLRLAGVRSEVNGVEPFVGGGIGVFLPRRAVQTLEQGGFIRTQVYAPGGPQQVYYRDYTRYESTTLSVDTGYGAYGRAGLAIRIAPRLAISAEIRYTHILFFLSKIEMLYREERLDPDGGAREIYYGTNVQEFAGNWPAPDPNAVQTTARGGDLIQFDDGRVFYREEVRLNTYGYYERRRDDRTRQIGKPAVGASSVEATAGLIVNY